MSGLFGYLGGRGQEPARQVVERMGARMRHQAHFVVETAAPRDDVALGWIGIGIFNRARQPVRSDDGRVWLWLCGEFYHQRARREALWRAGALARDGDDAALALQVYLRQGASGLTGLEGTFVLAVWDGRAGELLLINDRFGLYPHYYAYVRGGLAFGPEIKGVLEAPVVPRRINRTALAEYVRFQQLLGDKTWFEDVLQLPPAGLLRYCPARHRLDLGRYWEAETPGRRAAITPGEAADEAARLLQRAVDARIGPPYRVGLYLSGGMDSRLLLAFIGRQVPVATLTYGQPGTRDVVYAAELARRAGSSHHWFPFWDGRWVIEHAPLHLALTEGLHSWIHAHGMHTLAEARARVDVGLNGFGGGGAALVGNVAREAFAGRAGLSPTSGQVELVRRLYDDFCQRFTWPGLTESEAATLFGGRGDAGLRGLAFDSLRAELARAAREAGPRGLEYLAIKDLRRRPLQNMVVFTRAAIEVRCPYYDYDYSDFVHSLPDHLRASPTLPRAMLSRRMPALALVPYDRDDRLPHSNPLIRQAHATVRRVRNRVNRHLAPIFPERPRLYADYEQWLRTDLREWAEAILFDPRTIERGFFDPDGVRALWERHLAGRELWTIGKVAPLITLELVLRELYDGSGEATRMRPNAAPAELTEDVD